jgi:monoamine oxidase
MYYALTGLIDGDLAKYWCKRSEQELITSITAQYQYLYNTQEIPVKTIVQYWPNEQFSGGCYSAIFPPNVLSQYGSVLRKPIQFDDSKTPNIWVASTETALEWIGYMAGALEAGERTIKEIIETI